METITLQFPDVLVSDTAAALVRTWAPLVGAFAGPLDGVADVDRIALVLAAIASKTLADFRVETARTAAPELTTVALGVDKLVPQSLPAQPEGGAP